VQQTIPVRQTYTAGVESGADQRERLILEHLPQVRLIARRIHERLPESVSLEDLISTGVVVDWTGLPGSKERSQNRSKLRLPWSSSACTEAPGKKRSLLS
jgi:hypothetical protein